MILKINCLIKKNNRYKVLSKMIIKLLQGTNMEILKHQEIKYNMNHSLTNN